MSLSEAFRMILLPTLVLAASSCCRLDCKRQVDMAYEGLDAARTRLRQADVKARKEILAKALNPDNRSYELFPSEVLNAEEFLSWTLPLRYSLNEDTRKRIYLIDAILRFTEGDGNPPYEVLELGAALVPRTKSLRYSEDQMSDSIDTKVLREELKEERSRLTGLGLPARM